MTAPQSLVDIAIAAITRVCERQGWDAQHNRTLKAFRAASPIRSCRDE